MAVLIVVTSLVTPVHTVAQVSTQPSPKVLASSADYPIGPGDQLEIRVFRQPEMGGRYRVSELGTIHFPFVGTVVAAGLTEARLADSIRIGLTRIMRHPEVNVSVVEFQAQTVTIIGAVKNAGRYALHRSERLLDIIGLAGGLNDNAGKMINLFHAKPDTVNELTPGSDTASPEKNVDFVTISMDDLLSGNLEFNQRVFSGDLISIPEADTIYVTGNVNKPGAFTAKDSITLTQAIALAGGVTSSAQKNRICLYRGKAGSAQRKEFTFNLKEIEKHKLEDPVLQTNDVVYISGSESRSIALAFVRALTGGLGGAAGYALFR